VPDDLTQNSDREILLGSAGERDDQTRPMRTPRRTTLGPFRLEEKIGEGGMGIVYRAHDPQLDRWVAIKRIHSRYERDEAYNRLFLGEARAVASVSHPNIAQIYSIHPG
jgi:serine/threonine protein kinase